MLQRFAIFLSLTILVGAVAMSQGAKVGGEARQIAMGGSNLGTGAVLNPFITEDPVLLLINPAYQTHYMNYVWWNVGGGTLNNLSTADNGYNKQNVGVSFGISKDFTIGAVFSYDPTMANNVSQILKGGTFGVGPLGVTLPAYVPAVARGLGVTGPQTIGSIANVWEILAGYRVGGLELGFGFMYGRTSSTTDASVAATSSNKEASARMFGFRAGLLLDMGSGSNFSASGSLHLDKATDIVKFSPVIANDGGEYSASGTEIELSARMKLRMSNKFSFVPTAGALILSAEPKEDAPRNTVAPRTDSEKLSALALTIGVGGEYKTSSVLIAGGLSYQMLRAKGEFSTTTPQTSSTQTTSFTSIPTINLGVEWWLTDWLAARGGYYRMLGSTDSKLENSAGTTSSTSETQASLPHSFVLIGGLNPATWDGVVTLGVGMRFGNFSLDATVSDEALRRGLGLLGSADNINTFGYMTMSYNFE